MGGLPSFGRVRRERTGAPSRARQRVSRLDASAVRAFDLFAELSDAELEEWADAATIQTFVGGTVIAEPDEPSHGVHLLLAGTVECLTRRAGRLELVGHGSAPTWIGAISSLTGGTFGFRMRASGEVRAALIPAARFVELSIAHRSVFRGVMAQVRPVSGRQTSSDQDRVHLASLGAMASGLAHEIDNPAAAATRAAADLADALDVLGSTVSALAEAGLSGDAAVRLTHLRQHALATLRSPRRSSVLALDDAEDELEEALASTGMGVGCPIAAPLAAGGLDRAFVERVVDVVGPATEPGLHWIAASLTAAALVTELSEAVRRITGLVGVVKSYADLDGGELVPVDLHASIDATLTVLLHRLRQTQIVVIRDYDASIPLLLANGAELNQVWTSMLDNAVDALGHNGTIRIATRRDGADVRVDVADDGPGPPSEVGGRIFEPYFTTKDKDGRHGGGFGLGLETARGIVVDHHRGTLTLRSNPGRTVLRTRLPIERAVESAGRPP